MSGSRVTGLSTACAVRMLRTKQDGDKADGNYGPGILKLDLASCLLGLGVIVLAESHDFQCNRRRDNNKDGTADPHAHVP